MSDPERGNTTPPMRILAVGAHPDDVELSCAGTLARCIQRGDHVTIVVLCNGDSASFDLPAEELVKLRSQEARQAAELLGAEIIQLGLSDYGVDVNLSTNRLLAEAIRQANPDVILTHFHTDYGSDHNNTFALVRDAALTSTVPSIRTSSAAIARQPAIYMWEPVGGFNFQPEVYVDITGTIGTKLKMLECHRSQREWLSRHGGFDFAEYIQVVARFRGYQSSVQMAEGFVPLKNWASVRTGSLLP